MTPEDEAPQTGVPDGSGYGDGDDYAHIADPDPDPDAGQGGATTSGSAPAPIDPAPSSDDPLQDPPTLETPLGLQGLSKVAPDLVVQGGMGSGLGAPFQPPLMLSPSGGGPGRSNVLPGAQQPGPAQGLLTGSGAFRSPPGAPGLLTGSTAPAPPAASGYGGLFSARQSGNGATPNSPAPAPGAPGAPGSRPVTSQVGSRGYARSITGPAPPRASSSDFADRLKALDDYRSQPGVEGRRTRIRNGRKEQYVYEDSRHLLTGGVGHKIQPQDPLKNGDPIPDAPADRWLAHDSASALNTAYRQAGQAGVKDPRFPVPLASPNFQLGHTWNSQVRRTGRDMVAGDSSAAADEAARSNWNRLTPSRVRAFQGALRALRPKGE